MVNIEARGYTHFVKVDSTYIILWGKFIAVNIDLFAYIYAIQHNI